MRNLPPCRSSPEGGKRSMEPGDLRGGGASDRPHRWDQQHYRVAADDRRGGEVEGLAAAEDCCDGACDGRAQRGEDEGSERVVGADA